MNIVRPKEDTHLSSYPLSCLSCGGWIRTNDLQVMSLASYQLLPLRDVVCRFSVTNAWQNDVLVPKVSAKVRHIFYMAKHFFKKNAIYMQNQVVDGSVINFCALTLYSSLTTPLPLFHAQTQFGFALAVTSAGRVTPLSTDL